MIALVQSAFWALFILRAVIQLVGALVAGFTDAAFLTAGGVTLLIAGPEAVLGILLAVKLGPGRAGVRKGLIALEISQLVLLAILIAVGVVIMLNTSDGELAGAILIGVSVVVSFLPEWALIALTRPAAKEYLAAAPGRPALHG